VPEKHLLRAIDRFVDLSGVRGHLSPFYSETGRPSIDPELLIRMLIAAIASASVRNDGCAKRFT
jgi:transposase